MGKALNVVLSGRDRRRLQMAHETGYLDVQFASGPQLLEAYSFWCWRRRVPMVWFERRSRHSKYGRLHLDMFTTPFRLSARGRATLEAIESTSRKNEQARISVHDACWNWVPLQQLEGLAGHVLASSTRSGSYEPNKPKLISISARRREPLAMPGAARAAFA